MFEKTVKVNATIYYTMDRKHPDFQYVKDTKKELSYMDTYIFDVGMYPTKEDRERYMKSDLRLVAGGGYDSKHIHNVKFVFG